MLQLQEMDSKQFRQMLADGRIVWNGKKYVSSASNLIQFEQPEKVKKKQNNRVKNANEHIINGIKFGSNLESYMYSLLTDYKIPFEFQYSFVLQEKCTAFDQNIRKITWKSDFYLPEHKIVIDTKGYPTEIAKMKIKMFKYKVSTGELDIKELHLPSKKDQCLILALKLRS